MFCKTCGSPLNVGDKSCRVCGAKVNIDQDVVSPAWVNNQAGQVEQTGQADAVSPEQGNKDFSWSNEGFDVKENQAKGPVDFKWSPNESPKPYSPQAAEIAAAAKQKNDNEAIIKRVNEASGIFKDDTFNLRNDEAEESQLYFNKKNAAFQELLEEKVYSSETIRKEVDENRNRVENVMTEPIPTPQTLVSGDDAIKSVDERIAEFLRKADIKMLEEIEEKARMKREGLADTVTPPLGGIDELPESSGRDAPEQMLNQLFSERSYEHLSEFFNEPEGMQKQAGEAFDNEKMPERVPQPREKYNAAPASAPPPREQYDPARTPAPQPREQYKPAPAPAPQPREQYNPAPAPAPRPSEQYNPAPAPKADSTLDNMLSSFSTTAQDQYQTAQGGTAQTVEPNQTTMPAPGGSQYSGPRPADQRMPGQYGNMSPEPSKVASSSFLSEELRAKELANSNDPNVRVFHSSQAVQQGVADWPAPNPLMAPNPQAGVDEDRPSMPDIVNKPVAFPFDEDGKKTKAEASKGKPKKGRASTVLLNVLIVIGLISVVCFAIIKFAPDTGIANVLNGALDKVVSIFHKGESQGAGEIPFDQQGENPQGDNFLPPLTNGKALVESQINDNNYNILQIKYDGNACYKEGTAYPFEGAGQSKPIENDFMAMTPGGPLRYSEQAVATVIRYNSKLISYINTESDASVLDEIMDGSSLLFSVSSRLDMPAHYEITKLGIGEIRIFNQEIYVWASESTKSTINDQTKSENCLKLYKLIVVVDKILVSDVAKI